MLLYWLCRQHCQATVPSCLMESLYNARHQICINLHARQADLIGYNAAIFDETLPHTKEALLASEFHQIRQACKPLLASLVKLCATAHCVPTFLSE